MDKQQIKALLLKYESGTCTEEEKALLETWFLRQQADELPSSSEIDEDLDEVWENLSRSNRKPSRLIHWPRIAAAASIILCLAVGGYFMLQKQQPVQQVAQNQSNDILPGSNKAVLTLANGKKINLSDAGNGKLAQQQGISISKSGNGQITYTVSDNKDAGNTVAYNTIETPVGGQYQVKLPDGTRVWLNAASTLRYPVFFMGKTREVQLAGEAYFEVAHNKKIPFRVINARQTIEVLGTHFNVMSYPEEDAIETTLLEGSIKINSGTQVKIISPGQQAQVTSSGMNIADDADLDAVVAWKNGKIQFADAKIETIMRMLARWYNIDVQYSGTLVNTSFGGSVSRSKNLSEVLKVLQATGDVHFKIEGRRVTVMP
ncbi:MAG: FecR domain-containing protein [Mucilaginibacter sp.]|uniref:FecR family protein n=1 Tax=Mucilaginibacter sp. TaxID=1882438 RepID=UPI0031AB5235